MDIRNYTKQTTFRLILGGLVLLFIVGDGLILAIYGPEAAISGLICLGTGLIPVVLIVGILWIMEMIVKKNSNN